MEVANTLAYYDMETKSCIRQAPGLVKLNLIDQKFFFETEIELRPK
jgi:hypothetical protein